MGQNPGLGVILVVVGVAMIAFHRPLGAFQVRSQPAWMHPWRSAERFSSAIILAIGIAVAVSGCLEIVDITRWLAHVAS